MLTLIKYKLRHTKAIVEGVLEFVVCMAIGVCMCFILGALVLGYLVAILKLFGVSV